MKRILLVVFVLSMGNLAWAQSTPPPTGSWQSFAILANTTVTNTGTTIVKGDLGVSPGTAVTGFPTGILSEGTIHSNDAAAVLAQVDANAAYLALQGEPCGNGLTDKTLGIDVVTVPPGVYCFAGSAQLTGTLTLDGPGVYVFQLGTTLTTAAGSSVVLANGATAKNVFWKVGSSATLGANTAFTGSIFALTSDTVTAGSSVAGRVIALNGAVTLDTNTITQDLAVGRWEIVHTSGDSSAQTAVFPGGFSTFLFSDGTGDTSGTFANSICVIDGEATNVVPTWVGLGGNNVQITITVDNLGEGPNFSMVYTGSYGLTPIPGDTSLSIPTITGTYFPVGDATACSNATAGSPGIFIATFLPTISSGSASGSLDGFSPGTSGGPAFDSTVNAVVNFSTPPSPGQMNGTVSLASNPTFDHNACFATSMTDHTVNALTINPTLSAQSGLILQIRAEGFDPSGAPTTLELDGYSANLYNTPPANTDPTANQITSTQWAAGAAIGEDNPGATPPSDGVANDGTNGAVVLFYGVVGGVCNGAGGADAPFHFVSGKPHIHGHRKHSRRGRSDRDRDRGRSKVDRDRD
jgi:type VI secretion system secreted protein VgrG